MIDVILFTTLKSFFLIIFCLFNRQINIIYGSFVYWKIILIVILYVAKAIAFDWNNEPNDLASILIIGIGLSLIELVLVDKTSLHMNITNEANNVKNSHLTPLIIEELRGRGYYNNNNNQINPIPISPIKEPLLNDNNNNNNIDVENGNNETENEKKKREKQILEQKIQLNKILFDKRKIDSKLNKTSLLKVMKPYFLAKITYW